VEAELSMRQRPLINGCADTDLGMKKRKVGNRGRNVAWLGTSFGAMPNKYYGKWLIYQLKKEFRTTKNGFKSNKTTGHLSPVIAWGGPVRRYPWVPQPLVPRGG
jgi:hypothetical protein